MNMTLKSLYVILLILPGFLHAQQVRVGIIADHLSPGELAQMKKMLSTDSNIQFSETSFRDLSVKNKRNKFSHLGDHRTDTLPCEKREKEQK